MNKRNQSPSTVNQHTPTAIKDNFTIDPIVSMGKNNPFSKKHFSVEDPSKGDLNNRKNSNSAASESFEQHEPMQIKEVYKQPLILCKACSSPISYLSFILKEHSKENAVAMTAMTNVKAEELILDSTEYLALSCPICSYTLGVKYVRIETIVVVNSLTLELETVLLLIEGSLQGEEVRN